MLGSELSGNGYTCLYAEEDADTLIAQVARDNIDDGHTVNVICDDTDVMILLLHHKIKAYLTSSGKVHDINDIISKMSMNQLEFLLLAHSFSGCDTVSAIFGKGKITFFEKD